MRSPTNHCPALDKALALFAAARPSALRSSSMPLSLRSAILWEDKAKALDLAGKKSNLAWQRVHFLASRALVSLQQSSAQTSSPVSAIVYSPLPFRNNSRRVLRAARRKKQTFFLKLLLSFIFILILLAVFSAI